MVPPTRRSFFALVSGIPLGPNHLRRCSSSVQAAQTTLGQTATYGCIYRTARLMYTVTYIPDPRITNPSGNCAEPVADNDRGAR